MIFYKDEDDDNNNEYTVYTLERERERVNSLTLLLPSSSLLLPTLRDLPSKPSAVSFIVHFTIVYLFIYLLLLF